MISIGHVPSLPSAPVMHAACTDLLIVTVAVFGCRFSTGGDREDIRLTMNVSELSETASSLLVTISSHNLHTVVLKVSIVSTEV